MEASYVNLRDSPTGNATTHGLNDAFLVASGDSRLPANQICWPAQAAMEQQIVAAFGAQGVTVKRAHPYVDALKHGFIWNQRMGMDVFKSVPTEAPLIVAVAVWQYSGLD